jgi:putative FmdB family regulatory protein
MPTYEYRCSACGHEFEEFQSITSKPIRKCPVCRKNKVARLIGSGAGLIFKGSGFYQTDYRSEGYQKAAKAETEAAKPKPSESKEKSSEKKGGKSKASEKKTA